MVSNMQSKKFKYVECTFTGLEAMVFVQHNLTVFKASLRFKLYRSLTVDV